MDSLPQRGPPLRVYDTLYREASGWYTILIAGRGWGIRDHIVY